MLSAFKFLSSNYFEIYNVLLLIISNILCHRAPELIPNR
jgi:hypothetical protein